MFKIWAGFIQTRIYKGITFDPMFIKAIFKISAKHLTEAGNIENMKKFKTIFVAFINFAFKDKNIFINAFKPGLDWSLSDDDKYGLTKERTEVWLSTTVVCFLVTC